MKQLLIEVATQIGESTWRAGILAMVLPLVVLFVVFFGLVSLVVQ